MADANNKLTVAKYVQMDSINKRIHNLLKDRAGQFITSLTTAVGSSATLSECDPASVVSSALIAASLDLAINQSLGYAYLIPYKVSGKTQCQFQIGYKGFIQLAQRTGRYKTINATDVREGEMKGFDRLSGEIEFEWINDEKERLEKPVIGYVGYIKLVDGFEKSLYMTKDEIDAHARKYSKSFKNNSGPWRDNYEAMATKTVLKLLISKYGVMSTQLAEAVEKDQTIDGEYIDNPTRKPELDEAQEAKIKEEAQELAKALLNDENEKDDSGVVSDAKIAQEAE